MRGELGGVDGNPGTVGVRGLGHLRHRPEFACHVGGAGHGDDDPLGATPVGALHGASDGGGDLLDGVRGGEDGCGVAPPGQQIGVVLDVEEDDVGPFRHRGREQVEAVGGVPREDDGVVGACTDEAADLDAGGLEGIGRDLGEEAGAPMDAGIPGQQGGHRIGHLDQGRGAGGEVEASGHHLAAADDGDERSFTDQWQQAHGSGSTRVSGAPVGAVLSSGRYDDASGPASRRVRGGGDRRRPPGKPQGPNAREGACSGSGSAHSDRPSG